MADLGVTNVNLLGNVKQAAPAGDVQKQERLHGKPSFTGEDQFVASEKKDAKKDIAKSVALLLGTILGFNLIRKKVNIKGLINNLKSINLKNVAKELITKTKFVAKNVLKKSKIVILNALGKTKVIAKKIAPGKIAKMPSF